MRTIGRRWPAQAPRGDFQAQCNYCGAVYRRSELRFDGSGKLMCPPCDGIDAATLDQMNQASAPVPRIYPNDSKTEEKLVETAPPLGPKIGGGGTFA